MPSLSGVNQVTQARWFPTLTRPLVAGLLTSGATYVAHRLGIIATPNDIADLVTPLTGFIVAAIAQKPKPKPPPPPKHPFGHMGWVDPARFQKK